MNHELINKYKIALELCNSNDSLSQYTQLIRETLYKLLQPDYTATIDEVVWAECFINRERFTEPDKEDSIMVLKDFTNEDWYAYSGAEAFTEGFPPRVATKVIENFEVNVIVANNGIQVYLDDDGETRFVNVDGVENLNRRYKIAIGNEICNVIDECLSKAGVIKQLKTQLGIEFERSD